MAGEPLVHEKKRANAVSANPALVPGRTVSSYNVGLPAPSINSKEELEAAQKANSAQQSAIAKAQN